MQRKGDIFLDFPRESYPISTSESQIGGNFDKERSRIFSFWDEPTATIGEAVDLVETVDR